MKLIYMNMYVWGSGMTTVSAEILNTFCECFIKRDLRDFSE